MNIIAIPRKAIEGGLVAEDRQGNRIPMPQHIVISITDPDKDVADVKMDGVVGLLRRSFWDIDNIGAYKHDPRYEEFRRACFSQRDATMIVNFVLKYKDKVGLIVCHCEAGQSRSAGVAAALSKAINGDDSMFFQRPFTPSMRIYRGVLKHWMNSDLHAEKY